MQLLFAHQAFPSQFKYLAPAAARAGHKVVFMCAPTEARLPGVTQAFYDLPASHDHSDPLLWESASAFRYGRAARQTAEHLRAGGFLPDVIVVHPGWGEALFLKDIFPQAQLICFLEFFFRSKGSFFDFEGNEPDLETQALLHVRNTPLLLALNASTWNLSPTRWQKHLFPELYQRRTTVVHEGINLQKFMPAQQGKLTTPNGTTLQRGMEIVTFVARHLEPIRGFGSFMTTVELILKKRPQAHVAVVGREDGGYGAPPPKGRTHKEVIMSRIDIDPSRVQFFGCVGQSTVVKLLQLSTVHFFLTYPFLISWSVLEAMATGCVVLASDTGPARDIITPGENGFLVNFFDHSRFAEMACAILASPARYDAVRRCARQTMMAQFNAVTNVQKQLALLGLLSQGLQPPAEESIDKS